MGLLRRYQGIAGGVSAPVAMRLLESLALSRIRTDSCVYAGESLPQLDKIYHEGIKRILGVSVKSHNRASRELLSAPSLDSVRRLDLLNFARHVKSLPAPSLVRSIWEICHQDLKLGAANNVKSLSHLVDRTLSKWNLDSGALGLNKKDFKERTKSAALTSEAREFKDRATAPKLEVFKHYKRPRGIAEYLKPRLPYRASRGRSIASRLLIGTNDLEMDLGRHSNTPRNERICKCCSAKPESALHFSLECNTRTLLVAELRKNLGRDLAGVSDGVLFKKLMDPGLDSNDKRLWYAHLLACTEAKEKLLLAQGSQPRPEGSPPPAPLAPEATPSPCGSQIGTIRRRVRVAPPRNAQVLFSARTQ